MNQQKNSFRIIGLRVLSGCADYIRKNLEVDHLYLFYKDYIDSENPHTLEKNSQSPFIDNLYGDNNIKINICSIVGKNGSGKSTIIELIIRIINNYAIANGFQYNQHGLATIRGLNAILYVEYEGALYGIESTDSDIDITQVNIYKNGNIIHETPIQNRYQHIASEITKNDDIHCQRLLEKFKKEGLPCFYNIVNNYSVYAFNNLQYQDESSDDSWIEPLFHKNDSYQTPIVINPMRTNGNYDINRERELSAQRLFSLYSKYEENRRIDIDTTVTGYNYSLRSGSKLIKNLNDYITIEQSPISSDVLNSFKKNVGSTLYNILKDELSEGLKKKENLFNVSQSETCFPIFRVLLIKLVAKELSFKRIDVDIHNYSVWNKEGFNWTKVNKKYLLSLAKLYAVYKFISIGEKYFKINLEENYVSTPDKYQSSLSSKIKSLHEKIDEDNSYLTYKYKKNLSYINFLLSQKDSYSIYNSGTYVDLAEKKSLLDSLSPIFEIKLILNRKMGNLGYSFDQLSSGMYQLQSFVATILYHLRNIDDSTLIDNQIEYKKVNIILDEIELYFHPEYQTKLIKTILDSIMKSKFKKIEGINILIATHSPFILSDIPQSNIIQLREGGKEEITESQTFAANICDILANPFFLKEKGFMGEFAKAKIQSLTDYLNKTEQKNSSWNRQNARNFIDMIGEPLLKGALLSLYYETSSQNELITYYEEQLKLLRSSIYEKD